MRPETLCLSGEDLEEGGLRQDTRDGRWRPGEVTKWAEGPRLGHASEDPRNRWTKMATGPVVCQGWLLGCKPLPRCTITFMLMEYFRNLVVEGHRSVIWRAVDEPPLINTHVIVLDVGLNTEGTEIGH